MKSTILRVQFRNGAKTDRKYGVMMKYLLRVRAAIAVASVLASACVFSFATQVSASEAGPNGFNIGFDFSWNDAANPAAHSASFLEADGTTVNNCAGTGLTASTRTCNFVFDYKIDGVTQASVKHAARWITWSNPTTYVGGKPATSGCSSPTADSGSLGKAPLTLFDCFNNNSFGQVLYPSASGTLSEFRMSATCLVPSGTTPLELYALIYELNADGSKIPGSAPMAATYVPLTSCPRATTWQGKTFRSSDFSYLTIPFTQVSLSAGKFYGVYFAGKGVPGTAPVGAGPALDKAKQATTTTTTSTTTTTTTTPWSAFKSQQNSIPKSATTAPRSSASTASTTVAIPTVLPTLSTVPSSLGVNSALRLMLQADEGSFVLKSNTPLICVGASRFVIAMKVGSCSMSIAKRSNGVVVKTVSTKVVASTTAGVDVVSLDQPTVVYFANGTSKLTSSSKSKISTLAPSARSASAVFVGGFSGNTSKDKANQIRLAQGRAVNTRAALRDAGVATTITIWSYGRTGAVTSGKTEAEQNLNRRAVIYVVP